MNGHIGLSGYILDKLRPEWGNQAINARASSNLEVDFANACSSIKHS